VERVALQEDVFDGLSEPLALSEVQVIRPRLEEVEVDHTRSLFRMRRGCVALRLSSSAKP